MRGGATHPPYDEGIMTSKIRIRKPKPATRDPEFTWDEPIGCQSRRGWVWLSGDSHPDNAHTPAHRWENFLFVHSLCSGWYLGYEAGSCGVPAETPVLASAYIKRLNSAGSVCDVELRTTWHADVDSAKRWVESRLREHVGPVT